MRVPPCQFESMCTRCEADGPSTAAAPLDLAILLIADDLTGACDAGIGFQKAGFRSAVLLGKEQPSGLATELLAVVTDTRNLDPDAARQQLAECRVLDKLKADNIFHKVDSAGRGNPGVEMAALAKRFECPAVLFTPAYPAAGRVVRNGRLEIRDFAGQNRSLDLRDQMPAEFEGRLAEIPAGSAANVEQALRQASSAGRNIWLCDASTEAELAALVEVAHRVQPKLLWSGSAGLAQAVAAHLAALREAQSAPMPARFSSGRTLVVVGTDHPVTAAQVAELESVAEQVDLFADQLSAAARVLVEVDWSRTWAEDFCAFWQRLQGADPSPVQALVLTGGDTAAFVLKTLGAEVLELAGEVEPGIPWSRARGGELGDALVLTKSGGFGDRHSLVAAAEFCQRMMG